MKAGNRINKLFIKSRRQLNKNTKMSTKLNNLKQLNLKHRHIRKNKNLLKMNEKRQIQMWRNSIRSKQNKNNIMKKNQTGKKQSYIMWVLLHVIILNYYWISSKFQLHILIIFRISALMVVSFRVWPSRSICSNQKKSGKS